MKALKANESRGLKCFKWWILLFFFLMLECYSTWIIGKESACNAGDVKDTDSIPRWEDSPGEGNGNPLQYSCLENPMNRGAWRDTVHGVSKSWTRLSHWTCTHFVDLRLLCWFQVYNKMIQGYIHLCCACVTATGGGREPRGSRCFPAVHAAVKDSHVTLGTHWTPTWWPRVVERRSKALSRHTQFWNTPPLGFVLWKVLFNVLCKGRSPWNNYHFLLDHYTISFSTNWWS